MHPYPSPVAGQCRQEEAAEERAPLLRNSFRSLAVRGRSVLYCLHTHTPHSVLHLMFTYYIICYVRIECAIECNTFRCGASALPPELCAQDEKGIAKIASRPVAHGDGACLWLHAANTHPSCTTAVHGKRTFSVL